ncbi:MAG: prepilin-type N-terminal cleavage/methylation domain-containing protein [Planctomycetota bacterium]|nr:MAG: prepilin-type N-terminal cleavage/methylation domain-containing protein [Planctomycetota bacterium]REK38896.1 MAG: prepilin-type N-terminal cleavage/methylation domain-containing protein [Planctomycetota bacterium]
MQPVTDRAQQTPRRAGFTIVELLVVILIIAAMIAISVAVMGDSVKEARIQATRTTIRQLDSMLQQRVETFGRLNLTSQAQRFKLAYDTNKPVADPAVSLEVAEIMVRKDRFRAAFPQRVEDLWGFDQQAGGGDDAPLYAVWLSNLTSPGNHQPETESSELLYLSLTEGTVFGGPALGIDRVPVEHVHDTDNDGIPEFVDEWGSPLRFYNWTTRLIRPDGPGADIDLPMFQATAKPLMPSVIEPGGPTLPMPFDYYSNWLNIDPDDQTGALSAAISNGFFNTAFDLGTANLAVPFDETNYHTLDTYHVPLIVSAGPDENLGLNEPTATGFARLALPLATGIGDTAALDLLYDNITNRQR